MVSLLRQVNDDYQDPLHAVSWMAIQVKIRQKVAKPYAYASPRSG
jgi:hypothetical protein